MKCPVYNSIRQNEGTKNSFQMKEQDKTPGKEQSELEMSSLPDKEFKIIINFSPTCQC